jgi:hypothetical protein
MTNWTRHLPHVGVLVLSAVLAAGAYSLYAGQTGGSSPAAGRSAADLTLESPTPAVPAADSRGRESSREDRHQAGGHELASLAPASAATAPASPAPAILRGPTGDPTVPPKEPDMRPSPGDDGVRDPESRDREMIDQEGLRDDQLDDELQDIGRGAPPTTPSMPEQTPSEPPEDDPADVPTDPGATPPATDPGATPPATDPGTSPPPTDPGTSPPTTQPDPSGSADPDAGLDDTPVGGLDQSDLGAPIDEPPAGAPSATSAASQAP